MNQKIAQTAAYYATFVLLGATISSLGPTLPFLADNVGASIGAISSLFALRSLGYMTGSFSGGLLYDRLPGHRLLAGVLLLCCVGMILTPLAPNLPLLWLILLLVGLSLGGMDVGSNTQLVWVHGDRSGPYLNGLFLFAGLGGFLSPLLLSWMGRGPGTHWGFVTIGLFALPVIVWLLRTPAPGRRVHQAGESERPFRPLIFAAFCLLVFIFIGGEIGFSGWIYTYVLQTGVGDAGMATMLNSMFWLALALGRLAAILLSARFRPSHLVLFNLVATTASLSLILIFPGRSVVLWVASLGTGFFLSSIFPTSFAYLERHMNITGSRTGVLWAFGSLGGMTLPWALGLQIDAWGPQAMIVTLAAAWGLAALVFGLLSQKTRFGAPVARA